MKLYVVPTPIGNLEDMTLRAIRILKECDHIYAEDTRETRKLLVHFSIDKPMSSFHLNNEHKILSKTVAQIQSMGQAALVSDAGTPAISDPGYLLVRECIKAGIEVECLPGATAFVPALVKSGLPSDAFIFLGFLPEKKGRQTAFQQLSTIEYTMIFYESPHRLLKTLTQLGEYLGSDRTASVSRELTKMFEQTVNGSLAELLQYFSTHPIKGEFVIVIEGKK